MSASTPSNPARPTPRDGHARPPSILVVDGRGNDGLILTVALESWGYTAAWAKNAQEALQQAGELRPDLVLLDLTLSGVRGGDLAMQLRQRLSSLPILVGVAPPAAESSSARSAGEGLAARFVRPVDLPALRRFLAERLPHR